MVELKTVKTYPFPAKGIFRTIQGEGSMLGTPMVFVRLAGCSVGCFNCDTDYKLHHRMSVEQVVSEVIQVAKGSRWVWITGGEPMDYDLFGLVSGLRKSGFLVAVATSGVKPLNCPPVDFVSVSPHSRVFCEILGSQINLVPGLNGLTWDDCDWIADHVGNNFDCRYLTPLADREGRPQDLQRCIEWVENRHGWKLGVQAHKVWGVA